MRTPLLDEECSRMVQHVPVPAVGALEDGALEKTVFVLDEQEVHGTPALCRRPLQRLSDHADLPERLAVKGEGMAIDVKARASHSIRSRLCVVSCKC